MTQVIDAALAAGTAYFRKKNWEPFPFQLETWEAYLRGESGLLNAPTGSGKTYALWLPAMLRHKVQWDQNPGKSAEQGLKVLWITPLRALGQDIQLAMQRVCDDMDFPWRVEVRNGDSSSSVKQSQKKRPPECLVTTPETVHLLLSQANHQNFFANLEAVIVDEWHELMGNKRGVQIQLALAYLRAFCCPQLQTWGISATVGNLEEAMWILNGSQTGTLVRAQLEKQLDMHTLYPEELEKYPWAGHLGIKLIDRVIPLIERYRTVLLFTNTRAQSEIWYQKLMELRPDWAGLVAVHHGSLDREVRAWVEEQLHEGRLRLVVCTSSLDLGVDFRPVEAVIQIGSPKGVARFLQRAGRSGHRPGVASEIHFVPTHALELLEAAALRDAIREGEIETLPGPELTYDVLIQFLLTLAVGGGFRPEELYPCLRQTFAFRQLDPEAYAWILRFITQGGEALQGYAEFSKVQEDGQGRLLVKDKRTAMRHRLSMGTIVSDPMVKVRFKTGGFIGMIEEYFISKLKPGDKFFFAGRSLEFVQLKEMQALVKRSTAKTSNIPSYMGGRISLTSRLSEKIKATLDEVSRGIYRQEETRYLAPLLLLQQKLSLVPDRHTLLIEHQRTKEGDHVYFYPFEGRMVHEILAALLAYRISVSMPLTFSIAMNDYGFELLSDAELRIEEYLEEDLFRMEGLEEDLAACLNESEMAKRKFRDVATISGLIFQGFPGKAATFKHLQSHSGLLYSVFETYDPDNLLLEQARREVLSTSVSEDQVRAALERINRKRLVLKRPGQFTPFSFPIMVDRLRATLSSESLEDRIVKMRAALIEG